MMDAYGDGAPGTRPDPYLRIEPFDPTRAGVVAGWVRTADELRRLAPSTPPPLTEEKVRRWQRAGVYAHLAFRKGDAEPVAYAELNRMRLDAGHWWLGHVLVRPDRRGRGVGRAFVRSLVDVARRAHHASLLSLIVCPDNVAAIRCYEPIGFDAVGEEVHRFGVPPRRMRMIRYELRALGPE